MGTDFADRTGIDQNMPSITLLFRICRYKGTDQIKLDAGKLGTYLEHIDTMGVNYNYKNITDSD